MKDVKTMDLEKEMARRVLRQLEKYLKYDSTPRLLKDDFDFYEAYCGASTYRGHPILIYDPEWILNPGDKLDA